jgi:hydrogenase nickel incorporation protein HypA/HybF
VHELSIAEAVVRIATEHAAGRRVAKVELKVGELRQVVPSALEFGFELVAVGTPVEGAELEIESVPCEARCESCGTESRLEAFPFRCSKCRSLDFEVLRGEELYVESLELEEAVAV